MKNKDINRENNWGEETYKYEKAKVKKTRRRDKVLSRERERKF